MPQAPAHGLALGHLGLSRVVGVQNEIPAGDQRALPAVADAPVDEERPLVLQPGRQIAVSDAKIVGLAAALTVLGFPPRQIGVYQQIASGDQARTAADNEDGTGIDLSSAMTQFRNSNGIEELRQLQATKPAKNRVVSTQKRLDEPVHLVGEKHRGASGNRQFRLQPVAQLLEHSRFIDAGVALDSKNGPVEASLLDCSGQPFTYGIPSLHGGILTARHRDVRKSVIV